MQCFLRLSLKALLHAQMNTFSLNYKEIHSRSSAYSMHNVAIQHRLDGNVHFITDVIQFEFEKMFRPAF